MARAAAVVVAVAVAVAAAPAPAAAAAGVARPASIAGSAGAGNASRTGGSYVGAPLPAPDAEGMPEVVGSRGAVRAPGAPAARFAFGSCSKHDHEQPMWGAVAASQPDVWIWLGDNVYVDEKALPGTQSFRWKGERAMREAYNAQLAEPGYARVLRRAEVIGTYDDHDYGLNNAGKEWEHKRLAARLTLDFLGEPRGSDRRARGARSGIYESYVYGEPGRRTRVVLLDTRFERDPLPPLSDVLGANGRIRTHADMLGEEQWRWLERTLAEGPRAELTILASSVPILPALSTFALGWAEIEGFHRFPASRQRLLRLLSSTNTTGVVMLGGDYHLALIDEWDARCTPLGYPLIDLVSSGLTHAADDTVPFWGAAPSYDLAAPNGVVHFGLAGVPFERDVFLEKNWGMVEVDWDAPGGARVHLSVRDVRGAAVLQRSVRLAELAPPAGFDARASWDLMGGRYDSTTGRCVLEEDTSGWRTVGPAVYVAVAVLAAVVTANPHKCALALLLAVGARATLPRRLGPTVRRRKRD